MVHLVPLENRRNIEIWGDGVTCGGRCVDDAELEVAHARVHVVPLSAAGDGELDHLPRIKLAPIVGADILAIFARADRGGLGGVDKVVGEGHL